MIAGFAAAEIVACALRPEGSWPHMLALVGFVALTALIARRREAARRQRVR